MKQIKISDATMKQISESFCLSFKEKIEFSKLLDKLGVDVIELEGIDNPRIDSLRIKSIATAVSESTVAVPVQMNEESIEMTWSAVKQAKRPRLQVCAPTSSVQVEYLFHKKPDAMISDIDSTIRKCASLCPEVEFVAADATRSEQEYLTLALKTAINAGASVITLCDTAGNMFPDELADFISTQYKNLPELKEVTLGICCPTAISMAEACAISAVSQGVTQICAAAYPIDLLSLENIARIFAAKSDSIGAFCAINTTQLTRIIDQIDRICQADKKKPASVTGEPGENDLFLTISDDKSTVTTAVTKLGYDLSEDDEVKVYNAFRQIAEKKERVGLKELDAIVASSAMQVPPTYKLDTYVITSGNTISATAHIKLLKNGEPVEGVYIGDGSIDAAFRAIENIASCHYELDDFQLQAVTEGREAMGQTVVKLRAGAKVYSGRGISTDIVGAGIQAYLSALNKIIYEEEVE
jgi:2-isopropylmalate synthase